MKIGDGNCRKVFFLIFVAICNVPEGQMLVGRTWLMWPANCTIVVSYRGWGVVHPNKCQSNPPAHQPQIGRTTGVCPSPFPLVCGLLPGYAVWPQGAGFQCCNVIIIIFFVIYPPLRHQRTQYWPMWGLPFAGA